MKDYKEIHVHQEEECEETMLIIYSLSFQPPVRARHLAMRLGSQFPIMETANILGEVLVRCRMV